MEDIFSTINSITGITKYSSSEVITPKRIVADMVDLLPAGIYTPEAKFLDPAVKSGRFLAEIYRRLMDSELMKQAFPNTDERKLHIRRNQLYGFATSSLAAAVTRKQLYDAPQETGNIMYTADKVTKEMIQGAFGIMKFDVVIGNPPYNNDIYLDFVTLGHNLASKYTCMITPAKWQAKGGEKNEQFRKDIVPYMSKIVFYPDAGDMFNIHLLGGVTYYLIEAHETGIKEIENRADLASVLNSSQKRTLGNGNDLILLNSVFDIIGKVGIPTVNFYEKHQKTSGRNNVVITHMVNTNAGSSNQHTFTRNGNLLVLSTLNISETMPSSTNYLSLYRSDSEDECKSFISYVNTRLIRFLIFGSIVASSLRNTETWRFVPDPGAFDHIFTDQELYQKYGLTQEEINIIESVIKERK